MIIRIIGQGQYRVPGRLFDDLNAIDNRIVGFVQAGNENEYKKGLADLIGLVIREGTVLSGEELVESDVIVPPADMTLDEARQVFTGTGIFQG
jgi:hypothetical protein